MNNGEYASGRRRAEGLQAWARRLARALKHTPDRLLHARRRHSELRRLERERPASILVICLGNICRSPYAAALLTRSLEGCEVTVESAGFIGPGRPSPEEAVRVADRRGIDLTPHRSRQLGAEDVAAADLVLVMDVQQRRRLEERFGRRTGVVVMGDLDPDAIDTRTIRDPYDQAEEVFDRVYERIERCVSVLTASLQNGRDHGRRAGP
jgi:protein-tyrosine phosphatase